MGRPKAEIPRKKHLSLRVTDFELKKIEGISKKLNITKTEAILRGIDLLIQHKPKKYRIIPNAPKNSIGTIESEITVYNKKN